MRPFLLAACLLATLAATAQARPHTGCVPAPAIASATPLGASRVEVVYSGVCGSTVKVKEKRTDGSGSCGSIAGCNGYYFAANTGDVTVTSQYGPGSTTLRVCDVSGPTDVCSTPVVVTVA